jgi:predicted RNase H-like nuclease
MSGHDSATFPVTAMTFIGVDLGWKTGPSGVCCLHCRGGDLTLSALDRCHTHAEVLAWIDAQVPSETPAMVAVDAPTIIPNETGMRLPDRLAHREFGKYHAGCYPANRNLPFAPLLLAFSEALSTRGFDHAPTLQPQVLGRYQIECFPHPAMVHLFQLPRILKYKKGRLAERQEELGRLRSHILHHLPEHTPSLRIRSQDLPEIPQRGPALKAVEDQLDSLICAYSAAHWWYWGLARNQVLGNLAEGYIVVPSYFRANP